MLPVTPSSLSLLCRPLRKRWAARWLPQHLHWRRLASLSGPREGLLDMREELGGGGEGEDSRAPPRFHCAATSTGCCWEARTSR